MKKHGEYPSVKEVENIVKSVSLYAIKSVLDIGLLWGEDGNDQRIRSLGSIWGICNTAYRIIEEINADDGENDEQP